jgi:hypothetical protein
MTHRIAAVLALVVSLAGPAAVCAAPFEDWGGHLAIGYARLFRDPAPGGSLSMGAGVDRAVVPGWRAGVSVGYHLLGSENHLRGSLAATVDYSLFDAALLAHWQPAWRGPVGRVSFGPALMSARADLSSAGGGAAFLDLAVDKVAAGAAVDVTLMSRGTAPVRLGLELGGRVGFLPSDTWTVADARLAIHY